MEPKSFDFMLNYKSFSVPARNKNLIDFPQEIFNALVFNMEHKYQIKSKVSEEVLQCFINYLISGEVPEITITNFYEYSELSQEFNQLKEVIQAKQAEYGENLSFFEGLQSQDNKLVHIVKIKYLKIWMITSKGTGKIFLGYPFKHYMPFSLIKIANLQSTTLPILSSILNTNDQTIQIFSFSFPRSTEQN